jgi:hypothetical protein
MLSRELVNRILPISALLLVVLFKFQNCSPIDPAAASVSAGPDVGGEVRVVDRWAAQKISFLQDSQTIDPAEQELGVVNVHGLCVGTQNGEFIKYQVFAVDSAIKLLAEGKAACLGGNFEVSIKNISFENCESTLRVQAERELDAQNNSSVELRPNCVN